MPIQFHCNGCRRPFSVPESMAGTQARCNQCGTIVTVPGAANELVPLDALQSLTPPTNLNPLSTSSYGAGPYAPAPPASPLAQVPMAVWIGVGIGGVVALGICGLLALSWFGGSKPRPMAQPVASGAPEFAPGSVSPSVPRTNVPTTASPAFPPTTPRPTNPVAGTSPANPSNPSRPTQAQPATVDSATPARRAWSVQLDPLPESQKIVSSARLSFPVSNDSGALQSSATLAPFAYLLSRADSSLQQILDLNRGTIVGTVPRERSNSTPPALSPDGKLALVTKNRGRDGHFELFPLAGGNANAWDLPGARVEFFEFVNDREVLVAESKSITVRDARTGAIVRPIELPERARWTSHFALSPGRRYLAISGTPILVADVTTGKIVGDLDVPSAERVNVLSFSPSGDEFAAYLASRAFRVWNLRDGSFVREVPFTESIASTYPGPMLEWLDKPAAWLVAGVNLVDRTSGEMLAKLDRPESQTCRRLLPGSRLLQVVRSEKDQTRFVVDQPLERTPRTLAMNADGTRGESRTNREVDAAMPALVDVPADKGRLVTVAASVPWAVTPDPAPRPKNTGKKPFAVPHHRGRRFSGSSKFVVVLPGEENNSSRRAEVASALDHLERFDLETGKQTARVSIPGSLQLAAVSPSGGLAATVAGSDRSRVDVWSLDAGQHVTGGRPFQHESQVDPSRSAGPNPQSVRWAGFLDEQRLATLGDGGRLTVWELSGFRPLYTWQGTDRTHVTLSPGGRYLVVTDVPHLYFLEANSGEVRGDLLVPDGDPFRNSVSMLTFNDDATRLAANVFGSVPLVMQWDLASGLLNAEISNPMPGRVLYVDDEHLMVPSSRIGWLLDVQRGVLVWRYGFIGGDLADVSPDGRIWFLVDHGGRQFFSSLAFRDEKMLASVNASLPRNVPPSLGSGARVALDLSGIGDSDGKLRLHLEAELRRIGTIPDDQSPVKLSASVGSGQTRTIEYRRMFGGPSSDSFQVTATTTVCSLSLVDQDGTTLWALSQTMGGAAPSFVHSTSLQAAQDRINTSLAQQQASAPESFFRNVRLPRLIRKQPRDDKGLAGLGTTAVDLPRMVDDLKLVASTTPAAPATNKTATTVRAAYLELVAGEPDELKRVMRWLPGAKRPVPGLRWGFGASVVGAKRPPDSFDSKHDVQRATGPVGERFYDELSTRLRKGTYGEWPPFSSGLQDVTLMGIGTRSDLLSRARENLIDVVAFAEVKVQANTARMTLHVLDPKAGLPVIVSNSIDGSQARSSPEVGEKLLEDLFAKIDAAYAVKPLPNLTPEIAVQRANSLVAATPVKLPLWTLAELRYYQTQGLLTPEQAATNYDVVLGAGRGKSLATGTPFERRTAIDGWLGSVK